MAECGAQKALVNQPLGSECTYLPCRRDPARVGRPDRRNRAGCPRVGWPRFHMLGPRLDRRLNTGLLEVG